VSLWSRLDRLQPRAPASIRDLSDEQLKAELLRLLRRMLNDLDSPAEVRADLAAGIEDLEAGQIGCDPNRDARLLAYMASEARRETMRTPA
jgi:hypothetical protein